MGANASTSKYRDKSSVTIPTSSEDILRKTYQFLRWIPVSEEFDLESAAQNIAQQAQVIKYSESTVIIQKGTVGEGIYIILSGEAVVLSEGEEQQAIAHIMEGEFFGEVSCFFGNLCTATVMTVAKAKLLFLRKDMLATVLQLKVDPGNKEEQLKWFHYSLSGPMKPWNL
ncbi:cGMP-dependent 3',5'-cGMP phosphodiesterase A [Lingula anatina]|uniref:cGMP-dependent 3',5'-cGMP phosphodiesterase A n=1 Tax=Lingula anatina TaxID=7574 RepID=A0A1S3I7N2_LINAN|nr:cGMP-dependent 3',5'-cGMP phosphodiesterase A [Lingula anatina]|eukprot:XP_013393384.1 cGMP-dependent 3',5'-cGMP phosphodiesterase A [Lingula anatina]